MKTSHKRRNVWDSDTEDDFEPIRKKQSLSQVLSEVQEIRKDLQSLFQVTKQMKLPPGLYRHLNDTFKCHICRSSPIKPPVIFSRCCKRILGCQECVDRWYRGEQGVMKSCPLCRGERAYAETTTLKGLDDFLLAISSLLESTSHEEHADGDDDFPSVSLQ